MSDIKQKGLEYLLIITSLTMLQYAVAVMVLNKILAIYSPVPNNGPPPLIDF